MKLATQRLRGVWSATPTPLTESLELDLPSTRRMVEHHVRLGVNGLFVAGSCGEGAWLTRGQFERLVSATAEASRGRLLIAAQVTDNSARRICENIATAKRAGADIAVIAPPYFLFNATPANILALYRNTIRDSSLPVGLYDRGRNGAVVVPAEVLSEVLLEKNVVMLKDSSADPQRRERALAVRKRRPHLRLLTGDEFNCGSYLKAGYDGVMLGGAIVAGHCARLILDAVRDGRDRDVAKLEHRMSRLLFDIYGGRKIACWLSGLKQILVEMGVFRTHRNILNYPLTPACRRAIRIALKRDADLLFPWKARN